MNTETELEQIVSQRSHRFSLGDCALVSIWLALMFLYVEFIGVVGNVNSEFFDWAVFGGAIL